MRSINKILITLAVVLVTSVKFASLASAQEPIVSFQVFYDELSPYGEWVNYSNLGVVWIPDVDPGFVPYSTQGHWIYTEYGWTWLSDYPWGWAPFHYGRWNYDNSYGWLWVPGSEWGPAWVSWRRADGYYGWTPLEPGISLSVSFGRGYDDNNSHWIFVRDKYIDRADINHYYINRADQYQIARSSSVISNTYVDNRRNTTYATGPTRADFQKATGRQVSLLAIRDNKKPGQNISNDHFNIYRPEVMKNNNGPKAEPARLTNLKDIKQPSDRKTGSRQGNLNSVPTSQPVKTNPVNNVRTEKQPADVKTVNTNPPSKNASQMNNAKQQNSNTPPNNFRQQNTYPVNRTKTENQQVNVKSVNTNPAQNNAGQMNNVKQQNTNAPPNNFRQQNTNPVDRIKAETHPTNVKSVNSNPPQNNLRQQNTNPSQNIRNEQKSKTSNSSAKDKKDNQKKSESDKDKKNPD